MTLNQNRTGGSSSFSSTASSSSSLRFERIQKSYILKEEIGRGSFGVVRKVQHRRTRKCYACKTIAKSSVPSREILEEEVMNLQRVAGHEHLIEFVDVLEDKKDLHIITELITGGELYERIVSTLSSSKSTTSCQKRIDQVDAAWMVRNILDAISYCHDVAYVAHRDLKASNFLFASEDDVRSIKIIDFGLSQYTPPVTKDDEDDDSHVGLMTGAVGTPYYVAPEVLIHDEDGYTNKCDVWSVGVIAYLILSTSLPFQGRDERDTVKLLMAPDVQAEYPDSKWKNVDPLAIDFCKSLLQKEPTLRPSAQQAMHHPWIVKHCGEPVDRHYFMNQESDVVTEFITQKYESEELSGDDGVPPLLKASWAPDESLSLRTRSSEGSAPRMDILSREDDKTMVIMTSVPEDNKTKRLLDRLFSRRT